MLKAKKHTIADSNVEDIGSSIDKAQRMMAAKTEKEWENAGSKPGLEIWRVENSRTENDNPDFGIKRVPAEDYRKFYRGDSYILLYTYTDSETDSLRWNVHYWIGSESTADEYGVAAYKTVELDDLLGGAPVQYREMEGYESDLFLSYFGSGGVCPGSIQILEGGHASGFRKVEQQEFSPRLFWVRREAGVMLCSEVAMGLDSLNRGDCFLLDSGSKVFIYRGDESDPFEKNKAATVAKEMEGERNGRCKCVDAEDEPEFWQMLGGEIGCSVKGPVEHAKRDTESCRVVELYSMEDDSLEFVKVADGLLRPDQLADDDVMLVNCGTKIFVSVGSAAPQQEKACCMLKAQAFIASKGLPPFTPIMRVLKGQDVRCKQWDACFASAA